LPCLAVSLTASRIMGKLSYSIATKAYATVDSKQ
jgi:hypothetical protein